MRRAMLALLCCLGLAGCERAAQNMYDQPRYKPYAASPLFADGSSARTPPPGTVAHARGDFADSTGGRHGMDAVVRDEAAERAPAQPYTVTPALLRRGQERYTIYCVPCHSPVGDGDGMIVRRGFPAPPSYHSDRLRAAPDRHLYEVITHGYGIMYSYADRVDPPDRWAIVAYIRALQLSQHAPAQALPAGTRAQRVDGETDPGAAAYQTHTRLGAENAGGVAAGGVAAGGVAAGAAAGARAGGASVRAATAPARGETLADGAKLRGREGAR